MDGYIRIGTEVDNSNFDAEINYIEGKMKDIENKLKQSDLGFEVGDTQKLEAQYSKLSKQLSKLVAKQKEMNITDLSQLQGSIDKVGSSVNKAVSKVGKWALAVFGVRSAYMFVRQAMGTLSQYDDQMAVNVQYISYLLASTLKPIIETIIQLAYKLLAYINYITQAWFGVNLFANASTKAFEKQNKALGGSVKKAKELKKQLAGFDEMNVLQDNGDVSSGGGGGGSMGALPNFPDLDKIKRPWWLDWIIDHKDEVIAAIAGIATALGLLSLGISPLMAGGFGIAVMGIVYAIQKLIDYLNDPTFSNFVGILEGIAVAVGGVAIAFAAWPVAIGAAVALAVLLIVQHFDEIKKFFRGLITWADKNFLGALRTLFGPLGDVLYAPFKFFFELAYGAFNAFFGGIKQIVEGIMKIFQGDFLGGIKQIMTGFVNVLTAPLQGIFNAFKDLFSKLLSAAKSAWEGIKGVFSTVANFFKNIFTNAWTAVKNVFSVGGKIFDGIKDGIVNGFKAIVNAIIGGINKVVAIPFNSINSVLNAIRNVGIMGIKPFKGLVHTISVPQIPKLAKGGIINMPGRGVPIGGAIAGESGREGVIPLTDSQQMALLGEAIGKYININATVPVYVGNRQIAREIKRINAESDFAYNR